jgi:hypothetical protein
MIYKVRTLYLLVIFTLLTGACGQVSVGIEPPDQPGVENDLDATQTPGENSIGLPTETAAIEPTQGPTATPDSSQYWVIHQDPSLGFRFALPCFWRVEFPPADLTQDSTGGVYHAYNYTEEYVMSFPRSQIPDENGAIKVGFDIIPLESFGLRHGSSLREFVSAENSGPESEILEITDEMINGQPAISTTIHYTDSNSTGRYYLIKINDAYFLRFTTGPSPKILNTPDVSGILNSITVDPQAEVPLPKHTPTPPPIGLAAACIPEYTQAVIPTLDISEGNTACGLSSFESLEYLIQSVEQGLQDRNTGGLRWGYFINDPFVIGYWGSEGVTRSPDQVATELANSLYAAGEPGGMSFTTDREAFPPLAGIPPESMFGPSVKVAQVVYSEGWGLDKLGSALLYFAQDSCGGYYWHGLIFSNTHFD